MGLKPQNSTMKCPHCNGPMNLLTRFCPKCDGVPVSYKTSVSIRDSMVSAEWNDKTITLKCSDKSLSLSRHEWEAIAKAAFNPAPK